MFALLAVYTNGVLLKKKKEDSIINLESNGIFIFSSDSLEMRKF